MAVELLPITDLDELSREVLTSSPGSALPRNLPDKWLRLIARDLDACWQGGELPDEPSLYMAGPLALVLHILLSKGGESSRTVAFEKLERYFAEYRLEVNLELVSRFTNVVVEPATLESIFEGRSVDVTLQPGWELPSDGERSAKGAE